MNRENERRVTIEDLLRLKRAERPAPEFWAAFDRSLREKQLAALVAKRPWWRAAPDFVAGFARYHVAFAGAALLMIAFLSTRDTTLPSVVAPSDPASRITSGATEAFPANTPVLHETSQASAVHTIANAADEENFPEELAGSDIAPVITGTFFGALSRHGSDSPSARAIAANLAAAQGAEPMVSRGLMNHVRGFDSRAMPSPLVEPLSQMTAPEERSLERYSSPMLAAAVARNNRDRDASSNIARRLGERVFEERGVRRVAATADSVSWKM